MKTAKTRVSLIWLSLMLISLFLAHSSYAIIDLKNVAGVWLFDENDGDEVEDSSGNGNHGALMGRPEWIDGKFGSALEFNGTNYVSIPDSESLGMTEEVTVMFYFWTDKKMAVFDDRQAIVGKHYLEYEVGIYPAGAIHTYTNDGTGGGYDEGINTSITGKLEDKDADWIPEKWYHMAWTLNGQQETVYVNGINVGTFTKPNAGTKAQTHPLEIARRVGGSLPFVGAVDEVIILNIALEQEDVELAAEKGLEVALGITAVSPVGRLAKTWAAIKEQ